MQTLWTQAPKVPHHVRVLQVSLRISLLRVDEGWKLNAQIHKNSGSVQKTFLSNKSRNLSVRPSICLSHQKCIPDEEDGCVIACQVPVALFSVEFHCKTSRVPDCISRTRLTS